MQTKSLLYGLIGFFLGGFIVSVAATTFDRPSEQTAGNTINSLTGKQGDEYDKAFIAEMIGHHQGAIDMAKLSAANAKHDEIKQLSKDIVAAQEKEIAQMKQWQAQWGYPADSAHGSGH